CRNVGRYETDDGDCEFGVFSTRQCKGPLLTVDNPRYAPSLLADRYGESARVGYLLNAVGRWSTRLTKLDFRAEGQDYGVRKEHLTLVQIFNDPANVLLNFLTLKPFQAVFIVVGDPADVSDAHDIAGAHKECECLH